MIPCVYAVLAACAGATVAGTVCTFKCTGDDMKRVLFIVIALTLGMNGIFFLLPLPPWEKISISGIYGGLIGWISMKLR